MKAKLLNLLMVKNRENSGMAGVAALPTLLLVGGIVTIISISLTTSVYLYINSTQGANLSLRALSGAKSGAYDGLLKVVRNKSLSNIPTEDRSYTFSVGNQSAAVVICSETADCGGAGKFKVSSTGSALTRRKKIEAIVSVDSTTGLVKLESMTEVAL